MRLTLRTLLAYMDDILEPADHEDLGRKIEASDFASELIHRSRDTVRRLRLGAPAVLAGGSDDVLDSVDLGDANSVAEYLDNTLPPEQVADFERMCLEQGAEPDMHLAEVASCHHVLTMVLGEPAEVDADLKSTMYQLPGNVASGRRLRIEPAHASSGQVARVATPPLQQGKGQQGKGQQGKGQVTGWAAPPLAQPAEIIESELPDYLREAAASKRRSRRWAIATTLLVTSGLFFLWYAITPPAVLPTDVAQSDGESFVDGEIDIKVPSELPIDAMPGSEDGSSDAPIFVPESAITEAPAFVPAPSAGLEAAPSLPAETAATEPTRQEQRELDVFPPFDLSGAVAPPVAEPQLEIAIDPPLKDLNSRESDTPAASVATSPESPEVEAKEPESATEPLLIAAAASIPTPKDLPLTPGVPIATVVEESPAPEPAEPQRLGNYLGNNDVLLIHSEASDKWIRMPPRSPISTGDVLLTLPKFRTHVVLADMNAYLSGGTRLRIPLTKFDASVSDAELNMEIVYGRLLLNASLKGGQVAIQVGGQLREFNLSSLASLAVEANRMFVPGSDYENEAAPIKASWYLNSGSVEWPTAAAGTQTIQAPAMWRTIDGIDEIPEFVESLPLWIDREPVTDVERIARGDLAKELAAGNPVGIRLLELTDGKGVGRKKEVRILAAASSLFVGEFEPLVKALNDSDQKRAWETHINDLRQALALSPDVAARVRQAFVNIRGADAAEDLMEMVVGYNQQQIGESREAVQTGGLATLLKWMDHDSLDYRVLAIHNLREITGGVSKGYRPEDSRKGRKIDLRKIWEQFEANELLPRP